MNRRSCFSYQCNQCGRCCHNQVITLSPYDVIRMARAAHITTGEAVARYTLRRGSILSFGQNSSCTALNGTACTLHPGRPLACRLYPLGLEYDQQGAERYLRLEPAAESRGIYGSGGTVSDYLATQEVGPYLEMNRRYASLLDVFRTRIAELIDFEIIEAREFWRVAVREALAETGFDSNPVIAALFDPDALGCGAASNLQVVCCHLREIARRIRGERDPTILAAAAVMLAVSLGYSPGEVAWGKVRSTAAATSERGA